MSKSCKYGLNLYSFSYHIGMVFLTSTCIYLYFIALHSDYKFGLWNKVDLGSK